MPRPLALIGAAALTVLLTTSGCSGGGGTAPAGPVAQEQPEFDRLAIADSTELVRRVVERSNSHPGSALPADLATRDFIEHQKAALRAARRAGTLFGGVDTVVSLAPQSLSVGLNPGSVMRACVRKGSFALVGGKETRRDGTGRPLVRDGSYTFLYELSRDGQKYRLSGVRVGTSCRPA